MKKLTLEDAKFLNEAEGWFGLSDYVSANETLDKISPQFRAHPAVLLMRSNIFIAAKKWESAISIAKTLIEQTPKFSSAWIHRSFALHELKRTQEAYDLLLPAAEKFPDLWTIHYNLACYACQLGKHKESLDRLAKAIDVSEDEDIRLNALEDPDFEPLWKEISQI